MAVATQGTSGNYLQRGPSPSGLADVLNILLDKGLVIDVYLRVSLVGIELLTVDARIVVASVDTYLRFAEAVNRLDLTETDESKGLPDLFGDAEEDGAQRKTKGALEGAKTSLSDLFSSDDEEDDDEEQEEERPRPRRRGGANGDYSEERPRRRRARARE